MDKTQFPSKNRKVEPPFNYPGNQRYALDFILSHLPPHTSYVEPFCGGASVLFGKQRTGAEWINDVDEGLIAAYTIIRDFPLDLIKALESQEISPENHARLKAHVSRSYFESAVRWIYLMRTSDPNVASKDWIYRGETLWGWSISEGILECSERLENVKITAGDFSQTIRDAEEDSFLFVAPPYSFHHSLEDNRSHRHPFQREDHTRLAEMLKLRGQDLRFMVTYNDHPELRRIYAGEGIHIIDFPNKSPLKPEIMITNYEASHE